MNREQILEDAKEAILAAYRSLPFGEDTFGRYAEAALVVFEGAYTPTHDEDRAFAWAEYRKDYEPNPAHFVREAVAFQAEQGGWEYGVEYEATSTESVFTAAHSEAMARKWVEESPTDTGLRRRRPAGPWLPVEENGENDA